MTGPLEQGRARGGRSPAAHQRCIAKIGSEVCGTEESGGRLKHLRKQKLRFKCRTRPQDSVLTERGGAAVLRPLPRQFSSRPSRRFACGITASVAVIGNADPSAIDHLPALPAGKRQDADHDQGQDQALRHDCGRSFRVTGVPTVELEQYDDHVAAGVPPRIVEGADSGRRRESQSARLPPPAPPSRARRRAARSLPLPRLRWRFASKRGRRRRSQ